MKSNGKLNNAKQDFARVNITFIGPADPRGSHPVKRTDSIYLTTAEGELLQKKLNSGLAVK